MDNQHLGLEDWLDPFAHLGLLVDFHSQTSSPRLQQIKPSSSIGLAYGLQ